MTTFRIPPISFGILHTPFLAASVRRAASEALTPCGTGADKQTRFGLLHRVWVSTVSNLQNAIKRVANLSFGWGFTLAEGRNLKLRDSDGWPETEEWWQQVPTGVEQRALGRAAILERKFRFRFSVPGRSFLKCVSRMCIAP